MRTDAHTVDNADDYKLTSYSKFIRLYPVKNTSVTSVPVNTLIQTQTSFLFGEEHFCESYSRE